MDHNMTTAPQDSNLTTPRSGPPVFPAIDRSLLAFISVSAVLVVCGNSLVVAAVGCFRGLRRPTNYLLVSLAATDLLIGVVVLPIVIALTVNALTLGPLGNLLFNAFDFGLSLTSVLHLVVVNVERYVAIAMPLRHERLFADGRVLTVVVSTWVAGLTPFFVYVGVLYRLTAPCVYCASRSLFNWRFSLTWSCFIFFGPFAVACLIYAKIYAIVLRQLRSLKQLTVADGRGPDAVAATTNATDRASVETVSATRNTIRGHLKVLRVIALVLGTFGLCVGLTYVPSIFFFYRVEKTGRFKPTKFEFAAIYVVYANSWMNPVIYGVFNREFRTAFKHIVSCGKWRGNGVSSETS